MRLFSCLTILITVLVLTGCGNDTKTQTSMTTAVPIATTAVVPAKPVKQRIDGHFPTTYQVKKQLLPGDQTISWKAPNGNSVTGSVTEAEDINPRDTLQPSFSSSQQIGNKATLSAVNWHGLRAWQLTTVTPTSHWTSITLIADRGPWRYTIQTSGEPSKMLQRNIQRVFWK